MTTADKTSAVLDSMVAQVRNRRGAPETVPATATAAVVAPDLSGSVEQAREIVERTAAVMRQQAAELIAAADQLVYSMDLVFSVYTPGPKPVNVDEARKRAEAEADARQAAKKEADRPPASEAVIAEMLAAVPPIIARPDGWSCPDHGKVITKHSSRTGREYKACPVEGCMEIERRKDPF
jgi:hypothetical protein